MDIDDNAMAPAQREQRPRSRQPSRAFASASFARDVRATPSRVPPILATYFGTCSAGHRAWDREHFLMLPLDGKNRVLGFEGVSVGTLTASLVHPREVFKAAILANAAAMVVGAQPSFGRSDALAEDRAITQQLQPAGGLLEMRVARSRGPSAKPVTSRSRTLETCRQGSE